MVVKIMVPFLGPYDNTAPNILGYPKRVHNFDNYPCENPPQTALRGGGPGGGRHYGYKSNSRFHVFVLLLVAVT